MFVDKWEPCVIPSKPELTSAPIWLELRKVPFQFFNEDGLERIAGLVGHPEYLHPMTKNKTNLEVAKVLTIIDPRKPLPEAVNVQFESGEISRVLVSSPWMPPVCGVCKEIGHASKRCPVVPKECSLCKSKAHVLAHCPQKKRQEVPVKRTRRGRSKDKQKWIVVDATVDIATKSQPQDQTGAFHQVQSEPPKSPPAASHSTRSKMELIAKSKLGTEKDKAVGESSGTPSYLQPMLTRSRSGSGISRSSQSEVQPDSSDIESSDPELEEGEFSNLEPDFELVRNRKRFSGIKGQWGKGPKLN